MSFNKCLAGAVLFLSIEAGAGHAQSAPASGPSPNKATAASLMRGREALAAKRYADAARYFRAALQADAGNLTARLGAADAELGLHQYESAELDYRRAVATEPQMWVAHKNLVIVEAALGRWDEFDRERALLRAARERGAEGISPRESDVIDGFTVAGKHWIVREYFEPVGRSQARYNFELFSPEGRVREYISLENETAAQAAPDAKITIGDGKAPAAGDQRYALNWYTHRSHGTVRSYPAAGHEPTYEQVRADVLKWLRTGAAH